MAAEPRQWNSFSASNLIGFIGRPLSVCGRAVVQGWSFSAVVTQNTAVPIAQQVPGMKPMGDEARRRSNVNPWPWLQGQNHDL